MSCSKFNIGSMEFFNGDCIEVLKTLPDNSVDLFICDLPYGCLTGGGGAEKKRRKSKKDAEGKPNEGVVAGCAWDIKLPLEELWTQIRRVRRNKHTPVIHFCTTRFGFELFQSNPDWFRHDLVWKKTNAVGFLRANKNPLRLHEMIYVFAEKEPIYNRIDIDVEGAKEWKQFGVPESSGVYDLLRDKPVVRPVGTITSVAGKRCVTSVVEIANRRQRGNHPTQKPNDLYEWLISRYSKPGDTILDPTAGSFSSVFTANRLGRKAIGIEKDVEFYNKAVKIAKL